MTTSSPIMKPTKPQVVAEAVARLDTMGLRSGVLECDTPTLCDLGLRLTDRNTTVRDAAKWLNTELGGSDAEPVVPERNVYRYAESFRRIYGQVRAEHARRIARLSVEHATEGNVSTMAQVAHAQLINLVAEKLVETDNLEELSGKELAAAVATIDGHGKHQIKLAELALKTAEDQRKAQRLEADLAKMQADAEHRNSDIKRRVESLTNRIDAMNQSVQSGKTISPAIFAAIRQELASLAIVGTPATAPGTQAEVGQ